jgi:choline dehydrogenase
LKGSWNLGFDGHQPVTILDHYDYIVVGSGPGGAPLAARSGLAGYKVLMIEAGRDEAADNNNTRVLIFNAKASEDERLLWDFYVRLLDRFYAEARC